MKYIRFVDLREYYIFYQKNFWITKNLGPGEPLQF
jgi:hypothetical protein